MLIFLKKNSLNEWAVKRIKLIDEKGKKLYIQHPRGQEIDIVAIKLEDYPDVELYNLWEGNIVDNIDINITESCSVVGFPKGISTGGKFPIWKTGHVASEFELNHDDKPMFLIDASTREGMSGSPVYCVRTGHALVDGKLMSGESTIARFLGIYAGRVGDDIEIGRVFKSNCLNELMINYYNLANPYRFIPSNLNYNFT
ncbi:trypsin-like peptidase domain-containing protein [Chryseobacterium proteolyticum]|uniref:trypsin-like peptidase domain-containing protein n=1 Tax=Chryseobacterium proteolyticum TaxID=118127 RepID=UPI0039831DC0